MKTLCVILISCGICLFCDEANADDWVYYAKDNLGNYKFYDRSSISFPSKNIIRVWKKDVYSKDGIKDYVAQRARNKLSIYGYEELSHVECKEELNCTTKEHRLLACSMYDKSGSVVESQSATTEHQAWEPVLPDSDLDAFHAVLCKSPPKNTKKKK